MIPQKYKGALLLLFASILLAKGLFAQCDFSVSSSGFNPSYTQVYVLVNSSNGEIIAQNTSGNFQSPGNGVFEIHALNYDPLNPPSPLPSALIGQSIQLIGSLSSGCFNADFLTDFITRSCSSCEQTTTLCDADPLVVSSSGSSIGYTQLYVLVDASSGVIVSTSTSGIFTGQVTEGASYEIYALNYLPSDAPNPLPVPGDLVNAIGNLSSGCYNSDYLDDYICVNVTSCVDGCAQSTTLELGSTIQAGTSGENQVYEQVFVLTDLSGNYIDHNSSGNFDSSTLGVGNYQVHAINYNVLDPPSPLPSDLNPGDALTLINGGCFNDDFFDDYVCFEVVLIFLPIELAAFTADLNSSGWVDLTWSTFSERNNDYFTIEKTRDGLQWDQVGTIDGAGNSEMELAYSMKDLDPCSGMSYYRLKQTDFNGDFTYSEISAIENDLGLNVYPIPASDRLFVAFGQLDAKQISLHNVHGQLVLDLSTEQLGNSVELFLSHLPRGIYFLSLKHQNGTLRKRIILK